MRCTVDQRALSSNANRSENIVACTHDLPYPGLFECFDSLSCRYLQLILKDYEAYHFEIAFCCLTLHSLQRCPVIRNLFGRASYDTKASMSVETKEFLVVPRNYNSSVSQHYLGFSKLTTVWSADISHTFRSALHVDTCIFIPSLGNNNARSSQLRHELKGLDNVQLYEMDL